VGCSFRLAAAPASAFIPPPTPSAGGHTEVVFTVDDLVADVADLKSRGVVFEEFDFPGLKTEGGIATTGPNRAAWFKDSEGNTVGLNELEDVSLR